MNAAREQADRAADRIRSELLATLGELDRRRRRAFDLKYQWGAQRLLPSGLSR